MGAIRTWKGQHVLFHPAEIRYNLTNKMDKLESYDKIRV